MTPSTITVRDEPFKLLYDPETIQARVSELGAQISRDYAGREPIFIGVLNGAFIFMADLMRAVTIDCEMDFLRLSSYGDRKISSGEVNLIKGINAHVKGRDVIVVEDIIDSGLSVRFMREMLLLEEPASLAVASLLLKPECAKIDFKIDYVAFEIPNLFVIGYGLDYAQKVRNLPALYILDDDGKAAD